MQVDCLMLIRRLACINYEKDGGIIHAAPGVGTALDLCWANVANVLCLVAIFVVSLRHDTSTSAESGSHSVRYYRP